MDEVINKVIQCTKCSGSKMIPMSYPLEGMGFTCLLCAKEIWIKQIDMSSTWRRNLVLDK